MRITTQGDYALKCLMRIAQDGPSGPVSISRIVAREGLPLDYLEQLLLKLKRSRLIKSVRGAKGGYLLNTDPDRISVLCVLQAVSGEVFEIICGRKRKSGKTCKGSDDCALRDVWSHLKGHIEDYLGSVTLDQLLKRSRCIHEDNSRIG
ncbi:MAG: Rrf2 family transcriptional regulator [Candidatus Omnitrophota bacterium]